MAENCGIAEDFWYYYIQILRDATTLPDPYVNPPRSARKPSATPQPSSIPTAIFRNHPVPAPRLGPRPCPLAESHANPRRHSETTAPAATPGRRRGCRAGIAATRTTFLVGGFLGRRFLGRRFLGRRFLGRRFLGRRVRGRRFR